ncbi:four-domain proteases inhibitor-like [Scylla paramamosain]|uniref:four-domain proteases inhibitor-like n=1 Tax=Scylla paramamosain TaxID=85552 RepID=UPI003082D835
MRHFILLSAVVVMVAAMPGVKDASCSSHCFVVKKQTRVCGSDNNIYNNLCALDYQKCSDATLTQLDEAACKKLLREKKCRQTCVQVKPTILCGADGMLYSDCELEAKRCNEPDFQADDNLKACPDRHSEETSQERFARNLKMTNVEQTGMGMDGKVLETNDGPVIKPEN